MRHNRRSHAAGSMFNMRQGGGVSLYNYNPSIAGGKVGVKRFGSKVHWRGHILRGNTERGKAVVLGAEANGTAGIMGPGHNVSGLMGVAPPGASHGAAAHRKRVLEGIAKHLNGGGGKRMRC